MNGRKGTVPRLVVVFGLLILGLTAYYTIRQYLATRLQADEVRLVRVADGDTVIVRDSTGRQLTIRLMGVDAPELGTAASFRSALFAAELCEKARHIRVEPEPSRKADKYGRLLAWIWLTMPDGKRLLLNEQLIRHGHAKLYDSTSKRVKYYNRLR